MNMHLELHPPLRSRGAASDYTASRTKALPSIPTNQRPTMDYKIPRYPPGLQGIGKNYTTFELLHSTLFSRSFFLQLTLNLHIRTLPNVK